MWYKRRPSRTDLITRPEQQQSFPSRRSSLSGNSSPRLPFSPLDPHNPQGSKSSLGGGASDMSSPLDSSMPDSDTSPRKHYIARPIVDYSSIDTTHNQSSQDSYLQSDQNRDLYAHNSLNSFLFGSVQTQTYSSFSRPVHPLSTSPSDRDNVGDDLYISHTSDVTPRPSIVLHDNIDQSIIRSHPAQSPEQHRYPPSPDFISPGDRFQATQVHGGDSDSTSQRTSATSSASGSVISLSSASAEPFTPGVHLSTRTMGTSGRDPFIDDGNDHHHPIDLQTFNPHGSGIEFSGSGTGNSTAVEFSSDEDYNDSDYDDDYNSQDQIEIGSAQFEGSAAVHDWDDLYAFRDAGSESMRTWVGSHDSERRGSLPMAIPGTASSSLADASRFSVGGREDGLATFRRPSRSLDDDLRNIGIGRGSGPGDSVGIGVAGHPLPAAPISVPESDIDWKHLEERVKKEKSTEIHGEHSTSTSVTSRSRPPTGHPSSGAGIAMDFIDADWLPMGGITSFDLGDTAKASGQSLQASDVHRGPSVSNSRWLSLWGNNNNARRPSEATVSDSFMKAVSKWGGDGYKAQQKDWTFRREKADRNVSISGIPGESTMPERSGATLSIGDKEKGRELPKSEKDKTMRSATHWRGMQLDTQEIWKNDLVGRFKVDRRATKPTDPSKGPQQRLVVQHFRDPYTSALVTHNGPPVTIHKHSKAIAFSVSRHYKPRVTTSTLRNTNFPGGHRQSMRGNFSPPPRTEGNTTISDTGIVVPTAKRSSSMILLAPRRVQEAFTSTYTTRKLESYGLLDDRTSRNATEVKDKERFKQHGYHERGKHKEKMQRKMNDGVMKGQVKGAINTDRNVASVSTVVLPPPPVSAPSFHGSTASVNSPFSQETNTYEHPIPQTSSHHSRRRHRVRTSLDDDGDDDAPPTRTPHSETYSTIDASVIERLRPLQERSHITDYDSNPSFFKRLIRGRGTYTAAGLLPGQIEPPFDPPWLVLAPRNQQELQRRVVDNLNSSFKDVGLLPSTHKDRPKRIVPKSKKVSSGKSSTNIFKSIPADSLLMLLPLWPGETDPVSERKMETFKKPHIPSEKRQYLLVYYKVLPEGSGEEQKKGRGSRNSPTSSQEIGSKKEDQASILLSSFIITASLVPYKKLQGSGVRIPDEGLTVTGPLDVAFQTMPSSVSEEGLYDWVLGMCNSRETGIEFLPDAFVKMGLSLQTSEPVNAVHSEEWEPPEHDVELTPIGRAVVEMMWLGALALTSFGSNP